MQHRRVWLVSLAMPGDETKQQQLAASAHREHGFHATVEWNLERVYAHDALRAHPRIRGRLADPALGLWKPAIILEQLRAIPEGDVVLYHDVGCGYWGAHAFRMDITPVIEWTVARNQGLLPGVWLPEDGRNSRWTTRHCFATMQCDEERFRATPQIQTTYSVWQRNPRTMELATRWLSACLAVYGASAAGEIADGNSDDFIADRGAQSVLTNIAVRENVACFGHPHETTSVTTHPAFSRIPATDIGSLCARIARGRTLGDGVSASAGPSDGSFSATTVSAAERVALFTSIPPRVDRKSVFGFPIGDRYQAECLDSWRRGGFDIYSVHYADELARLQRYDGVTYIAVERSADEDPGEMKPSLRAILQAVKRSGVAVPGIVNSDILLLNPPGWVDVIRREIAGSVIAVTRYETNDIDRTCIGWAPWGFDLIFFDPRYIDRLQYCGMRLGECWWDYWLPLACHFLGATLKHVEDYIALHHDHELVSSQRVAEYGERFLGWLTRLAEADALSGTASRATAAYDICRYRFPIEAERIGVPVGSSYRFLTEVLNPTIWAIICSVVRLHRLEVVVKNHPHHRVLAEVTLRAAQHVVEERIANHARILAIEAAQRASAPVAVPQAPQVSQAPERGGFLAIAHAKQAAQSWSYRADFQLGNAVRRLRGKSAKPAPQIETIDQAAAFLRELDTRAVWMLSGPLRYLRHLLAHRKHRHARREQAGTPLQPGPASRVREGTDD